ncbi:MAG: alpha/beta fold hydrolase [Candidatus Lokiarchaeota archaeon]|nr:alpha/beta fold hydrolase [Candidatus Lokiarchaeota archaeon]
MYLYIGKSVSYERYERVSFQSSGVTLYANLYYPSKEIDIQEKSPLIIYCHGIGSQRDFDLRIPIEFTKRGFYIAALDYQGHGESGGNINNINPSNHIPALAQDCSKLLDKLETLPFYSNVNTSQIGLIGHSLGGMVVLMNQALDSRFNITVAWAPLVNFVPQQMGIFNVAGFEPYIPVNLINSTNTFNLLIIMHVNDEALDFSSQALVAQNLTGCTVIAITEPLIGGGHQLFTDRVIIESINWFESYFFNSETINGPIRITYIINYIVIFISLGLLVLIILNLIAYTSKFFVVKQETKRKILLSNEVRTSFPRKFSEIFQIFVYTSIFLLNWQLFERFFGFLGIFFASLNITIIYLAFKLIRYLKRLREDKVRFDWVELKELIKSEFKLRYLLYVLLCNFYFIGIYLIFSFSYPFAFMWPSNYLSHALIAEVAFPVYFSMELLFRKVIYPRLSFLKEERKKTIWLLLIIFYVYINLMALTWSWSFFPSVMFMYFILLYTSIQNTLIYENTQKFSTVILSSFNIVQLFFAAVISNALGIGSALHLFVGL